MQIAHTHKSKYFHGCIGLKISYVLVDIFIFANITYTFLMVARRKNSVTNRLLSNNNFKIQNGCQLWPVIVPTKSVGVTLQTFGNNKCYYKHHKHTQQIFVSCVAIYNKLRCQQWQFGYTWQFLKCWPRKISRSQIRYFSQLVTNLQNLSLNKCFYGGKCQQNI